MDQTNATGVIAAIRAVVPACIALAGGRIDASGSTPFQAEVQAVQHAVEKRRREFVAGRTFARSAMRQLGVHEAPIGVLPSRAPDWPDGLTGSISHSDDVCVALIARKSDVVGIGIDIESSSPLPKELYATVCRSIELSATRSAACPVDQAKMLFVVKEAFFKLYHPLTGYFLDFLDVSVRVDLDRGTFHLQLLEGPPALLGLRTFDGVCGHAHAYCFAFVALHNHCTNAKQHMHDTKLTAS